MSNALQIKSLFQFNDSVKLIHSLESKTSEHILTYTFYDVPVAYRSFKTVREANDCFLEVVKMYVSGKDSIKIKNYMESVEFYKPEVKEHLYKVVTIANFFIEKALANNLFLTLRQLNDLMYLGLGFTSMTGNVLFDSTFQKSVSTFRLSELETLMLTDDECFTKIESHIVPRFTKTIKVDHPEKITESIHFLLEDMYRYYTTPTFRFKINEAYFSHSSRFMDYNLDERIPYTGIKTYFLEKAKGFNHVRINNEKDC